MKLFFRGERNKTVIKNKRTCNQRFGKEISGDQIREK